VLGRFEKVGAMSEAVMSARNLRAGYRTVEVLHGIDIEVGAGEVVALFGPNGAGKTTTLLNLAGVLRPFGGTISCLGRNTRLSAHKRARQGVAYVGERTVFQSLSVASNLRLGRGDPTVALELFPVLAPLLRRRAGLLSGGEQQMLTVGRALAGRPAVLLADELSLGLAPVIVDRLLAAIRTAAAETGVGVLLVEQQIERALGVCDRGYVMQRGRIAFGGSRAELLGNRELIEASYLGYPSP
jgi:branched-chain amino acid transport system ATP-binding protein